MKYRDRTLVPTLFFKLVQRWPDCNMPLGTMVCLHPYFGYDSEEGQWVCWPQKETGNWGLGHDPREWPAFWERLDYKISAEEARIGLTQDQYKRFKSL
jgi:hypothetical protein